MIVCICYNKTEVDIQKAIDEGASSSFKVGQKTGAGFCCGACRPVIQEMVEKTHGPEETEIFEAEG